MEMDELPVGGGSTKAGTIDDEFGTGQAKEAEATGSLEERLLSKNWSVRAQCFDELTQLFKGAQSEKDEVFKEHCSNWKKYLADSNPGALEKCLDSLQAFIDIGDPKVVVISQNEVIKSLIERCIGHAKPTIRQKGLECFNLMFEVTENFDDSVEVMVECLNAKNIKMGEAAQKTLNSWLSNFGAKKIKLKPFMTLVENNANSTNPSIRTEAMNFYKECYKWLGEGLKPLIESLKKQQKDDLDKAFEEIKDKPKTIRYTRSEKRAMKDSQIDDIIKRELDDQMASSAAYDLAEPITLLTKYNPEWQDKILEMKKWNEKKELLDQLITESNAPKLENGDYTDLIKTLKKLIGDPNQVVSHLAIKACGNLAKGLRQDFGDANCKELIATLIGKFKEKKTQIIDEVHVVLDHFSNCTNLEVLAYDITAAILDKAPTVKKNICVYLVKIAQVTYIDVLQRCSPDLIAALMKTTDDQMGDIRDAALQVLGIFKGRLGEATMAKYLQDMLPQKAAKVNESSNTVKPSKYDKPEKVVAKQVAPPQPTKKPAAKGKPELKSTASQEESKQEESKKPPKRQESKQELQQQQMNEDVVMQDAFDEQPIGGSNKNNVNNFQDDDRPLGGGNKKPTNFDDEISVGGGNKGGFGGGGDGDELPIGGKSSEYDLDRLIREQEAAMMASAKPKTGGGPPARLKAQAKKDTAVEEEKLNFGGNNEDEDAMMLSPKAQSKPPPKPKVVKETAPKTTAAAKTTTTKAGAGAGGVQIQEEDLGSGLSKEEAEAKVNEVFSAESVAKIEESKWQDKVEGLKLVEDQIVELQPGQDVIEGLVKYVKMKLKDWKESNVNIVKGALSLFTVIAKNCDKINKRSIACIMPFLSEKLGDVKVMQTTHELCIMLSEIIGPKFMGLQVIKYASSAKSPKIIEQSNNLLTLLSNDFGVTQLPMKEMITFGTDCLNNPNPAVRTSAMAMFAAMYKQAGEMVKNFLKDVKESTMKVLNEEFEKTTPFKKGEFKATRIVKGQEEVQQMAGKDGKKPAAQGDGLDDMMPREDISRHINAKLIALMKNEAWKERIKGSEEIEKMLRAANMRIQPVGLNEMMDNIKQRMVDPNKAVLKAYIQVEVLLVEALGANSKQFIKKILPPLMQCFADKASLVRVDVNKCVDKWAENVGAELVMNHLFPLLLQENPELRTEALTWIIKYKDAIKLTEIKELPKPLVSCLQDKTPSIRSLAEKIVLEVMPISGYSAFQMVMKDLKPAAQNTLKPILEKIKNACGASTQGQDPNNGSLGLQKPPSEIIQQKEEIKESNNSSLKQTQGKLKTTTSTMNIAASGQNTATNKDVIPAQSTFAQAAMKKSLGNTGSKQSNRGDSKEPSKQRAGNTLSESIKTFQQQEPVQEQLNITLGLKDRRAENDRKNKWQTEEVKGDLLEKLKHHCSQSMGAGVSAKMFSTDFKLHAECIDLFANCIQNSPDQFTEVLDLIFKWSQVKLAESSNTQFAIKVFDFYAMLFKVLEDGQYLMQDFEALVIIPLLCDKSGINNAVLKEKVKKLIKMLYQIYDKHKCYNGIINFGLNSKNMKVQSECLDELEEFIKINGVNYTSDKDLKLVAKLADSNDKFIRENSLKVLGEIYKLMENDIWRLIGEVTPKVQGLIEQRFKKVKGVAAPTTMGLAGSNSSSNLFQPESQLNSQNDRGSPRQNSKASGSGIGLKKLATQNMDNSKKTITPRSGGLAFSKDKPPQGTSTSKMDNSQLNNSNQNFSKSINQFNSSNRSNGDSGNTNQPQSQQPTNVSAKGSMMKKFQSSVDHDIGSFAGKNMIPKTTRPETSNSDLNRLSGNDPQNQQTSGFQKQSQMQGFKQNQAKVNMREQFIDEYEVDDLMILTNEPDLMIDTELEKQAEEIIKHIQQLKHGDLSKRVDSLVSLNEMISQIETFKAALVRTSNDLINAFTHVLMDIFERPVEEIPLRFAKYFITIVLKACSCKEIMREASEESIFELAEQLLTRLLIDGLDKVGENKEGELILKNLNSSMLRLLENCNHTYIFCVLFNLLRKYKDFHKMPKLPGLIIKCLLKLSKILEKLIEKLDMEKILLAIHEYLVVINHDNKTQNDEMGIRIVKTVTNELVKLKRDSIWEAYRVIQCHGQQDNHIYRWIQIILKSLQGQGPSNSNNMGSSQGFSTSGSVGGMTMGNQDQEIIQIIEELRNSEQFEAAVPKLYNYLEANPQVDLNEYLKECSKTFQDFIRKNLDKYRLLMKEDSKHNSQEGGLMMNSLKTTGDSDTSNQQDYDHKSGSMSTSNRVIEYQSKIQSIKQRFNQKGGDNSASRDQIHEQQQEQLKTVPIKMGVPQAQPQLQHNSQSHQSQQNLNTSFSDMNSRLTQKWSQITKKTNVPSNTSHMSNTMGGFGGQAHGLEKASVNLNQSSLGNGSAQNENEQQNMQGASNSDLNKRLAEMKAKLQALKKK